MKINPAHLIPLRNEYSLISYGPRCFAIIWSPSAFLSEVEQFIEKINRYNPHRVLLQLLDLHRDYMSHAFVVVEMKYRTRIHQKYFTFLMWQLSQHLSAWIHIWDTLEHDALRRDFTAPTYMDSELGINRLWLKNGSVFLLNSGYTDDNPHGEFVPDVGLDQAIVSLNSGQSLENSDLSAQLKTEFNNGEEDHLVEHVLDITNVYIPKPLVNLVSHKPHWVTHPNFDEMDPTHIDLNAIPPSVSLSDEIPFTVAVSDMAYGEDSNEDLFSDSLTRAQWISLAIKFNVNRAFLEAKNIDETESLERFVNAGFQGQGFLSSYLMGNLYELGLSRNKSSAKVETCPDLQIRKDWKSPVCVLTKTDLKVYEDLQRQDFQAEENESEDENSSLDSTEDDSSPFFTGLEDTGEFARKFSRKDIWGKLSEAIEDPELLGQAEALTEKDLEQTADLEDFDDFVEYYAKHFLGYTDGDLKKHQVQKTETNKEEEKKGESGSKRGSFDWQIYNDDSDYESDYQSEGDVEMYV